MNEGIMLGHYISIEVIKVDPSRIEVNLKIPSPKTQKEVDCFFATCRVLQEVCIKKFKNCIPIIFSAYQICWISWDWEMWMCLCRVKEVCISNPFLRRNKVGSSISHSERCISYFYRSCVRSTRIQEAICHLLHQQEFDSNIVKLYSYRKIFSCSIPWS